MKTLTREKLERERDWAKSVIAKYRALLPSDKVAVNYIARPLFKAGDDKSIFGSYRPYSKFTASTENATVYVTCTIDFQSI